MVKKSKKSKSKRVSLRKKYKAQKRKLGILEDDEVQEDASVGEETGVTKKWDNSEKSFYKELVKVIEAADVIIEVLDARDPLGTRCADMENMIKKSITVGIIGLPNVGKSSIINSSKRSHVVNVGATPGLTRSMQEVHLDKNVKLLDCPGVVMLRSAADNASIALRNCKRIEKLDDPIAPVKEILKLCPDRVLVTLYKVPSFDSVDDFLQKVATVRGKLKKGGVLDIEATARIVLHDWNEGKIPYYSMPPTRNAEEPSEVKVVTKLGKEFNVDEVYGAESSCIGSLKSVNDFNPVEVPSSCPLNFDMTILEDNEPPQGPIEGMDDQTMESGEEKVIVKEKSAKSKQNEKLYAEEGMLNSKLKKAEKKRRKKESKSSAMEHDGNEDYDFKVDYVKDSAMEIGNEDIADESSKNRFALPEGVELDNE
ncbi:hypothetical protein ACS0TY_025175 [Phlomoides rotata]